MSMLVGYAWGKRYTNMQIFSVGMLTVGIITAAMADAQSKVCKMLFNKALQFAILLPRINKPLPLSFK